MALLKCKICGGSLKITPGKSIAECEYCGTKQTIPKLDSDQKTNLYERANQYRRNNEYDKAMALYEQILHDDITDAETYWSIVLCKYGIEYVEDPATRKWTPTINRVQYTPVVSDPDYKSAIQYADDDQRQIYETEAKTIDKIQKDILAIADKEDPFDIFICYKEADDRGRRTPDSVIANDLYYMLTDEGYKVFFSRITLEDKLGTAYEPYIFNALNSAKVMLVVGTKPEYFNAVWVKNEWSRYLKLAEKDRGRILIPCYRDMDPYDLPDEFAHLQAQDMSKLGFSQDLLRGINKILEPEGPDETSNNGNNKTIDLSVKKMFLSLEEKNWQEAQEYCDQILDVDPENAQAYLGQLMVELKVPDPISLKDSQTIFEDNLNYKRALRYSDADLKAKLEEYNSTAKENIQSAKKERIYQKACSDMRFLSSKTGLKQAAQEFGSIPGYKDADDKREICIKNYDRILEKEAAEEREKERTREVNEKKEAYTELLKTNVLIWIGLILELIAIFIELSGGNSSLAEVGGGLFLFIGAFTLMVSKSLIYKIIGVAGCIISIGLASLMGAIGGNNSLMMLAGGFSVFLSAIILFIPNQGAEENSATAQQNPASNGFSNASSNGSIKIPKSSSELEGENYLTVVNWLSNYGFTNITTTEKRDLIIGVFAKEGTVAEISINNRTNFPKGKKFKLNAPVVITYHTSAIK